MRRVIGILLLGSISGCLQPLRLAPDDSPRVLSQQLIPGPSPATAGPFQVQRLYYGSGNDRRRSEFRDSVTIKTTPVDGAKFVSATPTVLAARRKYWGFGLDKMPINGRVWYPVGEGPFPLVLIVHGNHDPTDFSDPGYGYLGELLASRGYIFASVDENFLNGGLRGENDGRGWMLLKHLEHWRRWNDSSAGPFSGQVDLQNIALIGHSRGGEAVAVAGLFNRLKHYPDDFNLEFDFNFGIRSLVAIAPVDGQYQPTDRPTPLENINYLVFHGSHDGDVSSFQGLKQYQRVRFTGGFQGFKSAIWMYRANHGQWNSGWGSRDFGPRSERVLDLRGLLPMSEQAQFAQVVISSFLDATLKGRREYLPLFQDHRTAGGWLPHTIYVTRFQESGFMPLATFDEDVDLTTGATPGITIVSDSVAVWREGMMRLRNNGANDMGFNAAWIGWNNRIAGNDSTLRGRPAAWRILLADSIRTRWGVGSGHALQLSLAATKATPPPRQQPRDSVSRSLSGRSADGRARPPRPKTATASDSLPLELSVEFVDDSGLRVLLPLGDYGPIRRPPEMTVRKRAGRDQQLFANQFEMIPQTFTIPLADVVLANPLFKVAALASVGLVFDRSEAGTVVVSDVGLTAINPAFLLKRLEVGR